MIYAYELLAKLRHLTLSGYENGRYEFIGKDEQWAKVDKEMEEILKQKYEPS